MLVANSTADPGNHTGFPSTLQITSTESLENSALGEKTMNATVAR